MDLMDLRAEAMGDHHSELENDHRNSGFTH